MTRCLHSRPQPDCLGEYHGDDCVLDAGGGRCCCFLHHCFIRLFLIPALHRLHFGQTIRESGPTWHSKKQGTPTMGGFCFILGILLSAGLVYAGLQRYSPGLLTPQQTQSGLLVLFLAFGSGLIGFWMILPRWCATATLGFMPGKTDFAVFGYRLLYGRAVQPGALQHHNHAAVFRCGQPGAGLLPDRFLWHHLSCQCG